MIQDPKIKTSKHVLTDLIKDSIGFDRGFYFTIHDLFVKPVVVFDSYLNSEKKYLSPFSLLGISITIYYLIAGFLIDWEVVSESSKYGAKLYDDWLNTLAKNPKKGLAYDQILVPFIEGFILLASKYVAVLVVAIQLPFLGLLTFFTRKTNLRFYQHLVASSYNSSISLLSIDFLILLSIISIWLILPVYLVMLFVLPKRSLRIYGDLESKVGRALIYSLVTFFLICFLAGLVYGLFGYGGTAVS